MIRFFFFFLNKHIFLCVFVLTNGSGNRVRHEVQSVSLPIDRLLSRPERYRDTSTLVCLEKQIQRHSGLNIQIGFFFNDFFC